MIKFVQKGDFKKTNSYFERLLELIKLGKLDAYGRRGVQALHDATPVDTGKTANSWNYEIVRRGEKVSIIWKNSNINDGVPIAIILQYGHGTRNGGYVTGIDYINPAIKPVFDDIARDIWNEVTRS